MARTVSSAHPLLAAWCSRYRARPELALPPERHRGGSERSNVDPHWKTCRQKRIPVPYNCSVQREPAIFCFTVQCPCPRPESPAGLYRDPAQQCWCSGKPAQPPHCLHALPPKAVENGQRISTGHCLFEAAVYSGSFLTVPKTESPWVGSGARARRRAEDARGVSLYF